MSLETARKAMASWDLESASLRLVAQRENTVYQVTIEDGTNYALRLHRPGYQTPAALRSELQWMEALLEGGLEVPTPIPTTENLLLIAIDGYRIDLLSWLSGDPMGASGEALQLQNRQETFRSLGQLMARVHSLSDEWSRPLNFERVSWDREGLVGENPVWGKFWENPHLSSAQRKLFGDIRSEAFEELRNVEEKLDYGLIHADLVRENILISERGLQLIDFDDSGFGFRLFEIATTLLRNTGEADSDELQAALINGYRSIRPIDTAHLPLFMMLRALSYVGWIVPRMTEPGSDVRLRRFINTAENLVRQYREANTRNSSTA